MWIDKGSELLNRSIKSEPEKIAIEMYSKYNEGKPLVDSWFITTLKNKIYIYMTSI